MKVSKEVCREEHEVKNCQNGKESLTDSAGKDDGRYQADHWYDRGRRFQSVVETVYCYMQSTGQDIGSVVLGGG